MRAVSADLMHLGHAPASATLHQTEVVVDARGPLETLDTHYAGRVCPTVEALVGVLRFCDALPAGPLAYLGGLQPVNNLGEHLVAPLCQLRQFHAAKQPANHARTTHIRRAGRTSLTIFISLMSSR